jgi:hypothetical protein
MKVKNFSLAFGVLLLLVLAYQPAQAGVNVGVGVSVGLPVFNFAAPPQLAVIPGTYAYYAPDVDLDILFYGGRWYRPWGGRWYWARGYNGPWVIAGPGFVPAPLYRLPRDYRHGPVYYRIPYYDLNRNWRTWERNRHWDHQYDWWRKARDEHRERKDWHDWHDRDGRGGHDGHDRDGRGGHDGHDKDGRGGHDGHDKDGRGGHDGHDKDGRGGHDGHDKEGRHDRKDMKGDQK